MLSIFKRKQYIQLPELHLEGDTSGMHGDLSKLTGKVHEKGLSGTFTRGTSGDISNVWGTLKPNYYHVIDFTNITGDISNKYFSLYETDIFDKTTYYKTRGDVTNLTGRISLDGDVSNIYGEISGKPFYGDTTFISGDITGIWGQITPGLCGDVTNLTGSIWHMRGDLTGFYGDMDAYTSENINIQGNITEWGISAEQRKQGVNIVEAYKNYCKSLNEETYHD